MPPTNRDLRVFPDGLKRRDLAEVLIDVGELGMDVVRIAEAGRKCAGTRVDVHLCYLNNASIATSTT
uniref:Uncharacterized protein n=1 Tax=Mycena chlorophos TaxID=658473 RepID=A0ABQ0LCW7_MYCCL|nr:predicted protein [Mycena chlorophos]